MDDGKPLLPKGLRQALHMGKNLKGAGDLGRRSRQGEVPLGVNGKKRGAPRIWVGIIHAGIIARSYTIFL
jgi:hypothetical protein